MNSMSHGICWGDVPDGFKKVRSKSCLLLVRADMERRLDLPALLFSVKSIEEAREFFGRGRLAVLKLVDGTETLARRYRHGGLLRGLTGDLFFTWPPRPFRELSITEAARARGVPTVEVLAAVVEALPAPIYRGWLITRLLQRARDVWDVAQDKDAATATAKEAWLEAAARAVRTMHRFGVDHRDLNLKNILLRGEAGRWQGYVIDFDKSQLFPGDLPAARAARNLARLERSIRKLDPGRRFLAPGDWEFFLRCYREAGG